MQYRWAPASITKIKKRDIPRVCKDVELDVLLVGVQTVTTTLESHLAVFTKVEHRYNLSRSTF
jgi:hypothetical protein